MDPAPPAANPTRSGGAWVLFTVAVGAAALMLPVAHDLAHLPPITGRRWVSGAQRAAADHRVTRDLVVWWSLFAVVVAALLRAPRRAAVAAALAIGVAVPVPALAHRTPLSNDMYRSAWTA